MDARRVGRRARQARDIVADALDGHPRAGTGSTRRSSSTATSLRAASLTTSRPSTRRCSSCSPARGPRPRPARATCEGRVAGGAYQVYERGVGASGRGWRRRRRRLPFSLSRRAVMPAATDVQADSSGDEATSSDPPRRSRAPGSARVPAWPRSSSSRITSSASAVLSERATASSSSWTSAWTMPSNLRRAASTA